MNKYQNYNPGRAPDDSKTLRVLPSLRSGHLTAVLRKICASLDFPKFAFSELRKTAYVKRKYFKSSLMATFIKNRQK